MPPVSGGFTDKVVKNSLRFRSAIRPRMYVKYAQARTSAIKQTYVMRLKRNKLGVAQGLFYQDYNVSTKAYPTFEIYFDASDRLQISARSAGSTYIFRVITNTVFRDMTKFMTLMVSFNTSEATATDRIKIYLNGKRITSFATASFPGLNASVQGLNQASLTYSGMNIGGLRPAYLDAVVQDVQIIDGQELFPNDVGYFSTNGSQYLTRMYSGDFGNNGGYYDFSYTASVEGLGIDYSGKNNHMTTSGFSLTSDASYDVFSESIDNVFATLDPGYSGYYSSVTTQNGYGNLRLTTSGAGYRGLPSTFAIPDHGKYYFEVVNDVSSASKLTSLLLMKDLTTLAASASVTAGFYGWFINSDRNLCQGNGTITTNVGSAAAALTTLRMCVDADNKKVYMGIDDTWYSNVNTVTDPPDAGGVATYNIDPSGMFVALQITGIMNLDINFGQRPWTKTKPKGYSTLSTINMRVSGDAANDPPSYFEARARTGTSSQATQSDYKFDPGLYWTKARNSASYGHRIANAIQGAGKSIKTYLTDPEESDANGFLGFGSRSLSVGTSPSFNNSSLTYVDYAWKLGGLGSLNHDGSVTSTVSASPESGTSVVKWKGTGSVITVGHGLKKEPELIILKNLATSALYVYAKPVGTMYHLALNSNAERSVADATLWNNTAPNSSVFTVGTNAALNAADADYVAFCFTSIKDYMKIGVYRGDAMTNGPRGYCGFKPAFLMIKKITGAGYGWIMYDNVRSGQNALNYYLSADLIGAEVATGTMIDLIATGFKIRSSSLSVNGDSTDYLYLAIAESALKYAMAA